MKAMLQRPALEAASDPKACPTQPVVSPAKNHLAGGDKDHAGVLPKGWYPYRKEQAVMQTTHVGTKHGVPPEGTIGYENCRAGGKRTHDGRRHCKCTRIDTTDID